MRAQHYFCGICAKNARPETDYEKMPDKSNLRDLLQNNLHVIFRSFKVMKIKERQGKRNCFRLKTKKPQQLDVTHVLAWIFLL